ncbi:MAG: hypothetical protein PHG02_06580 [Oscillospiraceae bacterium]|nr:hypothetical protein [Oscillospiraceae bacterium]
MRQNTRIFKMVLAALLSAIGILIPIISPVKIIIEPASFTLASHVAIFIAMFISPMVTLAVVIGTTLGFQLYGFPIVVVLRAASHVVFALVGAYLLKKKPQILQTPAQTALYGIGMGIIHGICEVLVVIPFYFGGAMSAASYEKSFFVSVILLVGIGTVIHSLVDFYIALFVYKPLSHVSQVAQVSVAGKL